MELYCDKWYFIPGRLATFKDYNVGDSVFSLNVKKCNICLSNTLKIREHQGLDNRMPTRAPFCHVNGVSESVCLCVCACCETETERGTENYRRQSP